VQSRRDQLQAYRFLTRRALAALVAGEPDVPEPPMRRLSLTTLTGVMVAIFVAAGFAAYGLIKPGAGTTLSTGTIYIERETGARFVLLGQDLHPTLNYPSAVLAAMTGDRQGKVAVKTVSASTLARKPHGAPIGIIGVPDSLPRSTNRLVRSPWTVCSRQIAAQIGDNRASVSVSVGDAGSAASLTADDAVVVATPRDRRPYLLWHGERLQIASPAIATALNLQGSQPLVVGTAFLNALPQGPMLTTPSIPSAGRPGLPVGTTSTYVGQLVQISDDDSYLLVLSDGVVSVTQVEAALLQTLPLAGQRRSPVRVSRATALGLPPSSSGADVLRQRFADLPGSNLPSVPDAPIRAGGVCVLFHENAPAVLATPPGTAPTNGTRIDDSVRSETGLADSVTVPAETAALAVPDNASATRFVIAAPGRKFAASQAVLDALGYESVTPVTLPAQLLLLIPSGPALDADAARLPPSGS
jgi:type VII secretion protein EccB